MPKNILMIGPTGCGKTEIARRLAKLADAPFVKVEATKYTEVGFHGRDVDQIIRDLLDNAMVMVKLRMRTQLRVGFFVGVICGGGFVVVFCGVFVTTRCILPSTLFSHVPRFTHTHLSFHIPPLSFYIPSPFSFHISPLSPFSPPSLFTPPPPHRRSALQKQWSAASSMPWQAPMMSVTGHHSETCTGRGNLTTPPYQWTCQCDLEQV